MNRAIALSGFFSIFFILFYTQTADAKNQITLHFTNPPIGLNWNSPKSLTLSTFTNVIEDKINGVDLAIGHVTEELECGSYQRFLGMSPVSFEEEQKAIFVEGYGLGSMMRKYKGQLDDSDTAAQVIQSMHRAGRSNFIRFEISESTCKRLQDYISEYEKRGLDKIYAGLDSYPLREEGSGCSAFGASFLEVAGLLVPELQNSWTRRLIVPHKFVGGVRTHKKINVLRLLFAFGSHWMNAQKDGVELYFYDPELMNGWVKKAVSDLQTDSSRIFKWKNPHIQTEDGAEGISFDARMIPTPSGKFFHSKPTAINQSISLNE